jgi:hypothetical protein
VADRRWFNLPGNLSSGSYRLELARDGTSGIPLATVLVTERTRSFTAPTPERVVQARFGEVAELLGYDLAGIPSAGATLSATLHWRALGPTQSPHTVFLHLKRG